MITTHVLDTTSGGPAVGMAVVLEVHRGSDWHRIAAGRTDERGRVASLTERMATGPGVYRLTFDTNSYQREHGRPLFFPEVQITFTVREASEHVHVPLLVSPFGYTTYRGVGQ